MKLSEQKSPGPVLISGYGDGLFRLGNKTHKGHLLVFGREYYSWPVKSAKSVTKPSLKSVLNVKIPPEFLILGLGEEIEDQVILSQKFTKSFGLSVEVMSTGAAARTYNVLTLEGRLIAAGLLAV